MRSPTNGELKIMIDNIIKNSEEQHQDTMTLLNEIKTDVKEVRKQAEYTNGQVAKLKWWKNAIVWIVSGLIALVGASYPILRHIVTLEIQNTINQTLSAYNIQVK